MEILLYYFRMTKGNGICRKIYSGGLVSAVIATGINMKDIIELLLNKRTRQDARKEYGIHMGLKRILFCVKNTKKYSNILKKPETIVLKKEQTLLNNY